MYGPEPAYHRGMILAELGRHREAVESFRKFRREPPWNFAGANLSAYPRSLYFEGRSLEYLGERAEAARVLDRLLRMWRNADPDLPYLAEARELRRRLGGQRSLTLRGPLGIRTGTGTRSRPSRARSYAFGVVFL